MSVSEEIGSTICFNCGSSTEFNASNDLYYCHACNEGGDVFRYYQQAYGWDWPFAVAYAQVKLLNETGVDGRCAKHLTLDRRKPGTTTSRIPRNGL